MNAVIIGAGSIGGLIDTPKSENTASHAHAYKKDSSCKLIAICEPNKSNQKEFVNRWGKVNVYNDTKELFLKESIDILSIATPTKLHFQNLKDALSVDSITHILCEKPLVETEFELEKLKDILENSNKKILINLIRRYDPSFIKLASQIKSNRWGKVLDFHGTFTKSLLHNGIHMLEVLSHFFGSIKNLQPLDNNFLVECQNAKGSLACIEDLEYSLFELTIVFENAKIEIKEGGTRIDICEKTTSSLYENYSTLEYKESLDNTLQYYATNSLNFLLKENCSTCKAILKEHIRLHEIIFKAIK